jgi:AcrR family transcriptional regulator
MDALGGIRSGRMSRRREALLQAAAEIFFEQGYAAASIDAIIERAGGSKRNIYSEFGNKQGLFAAIVTGNADEALSSLPIDNIEERDLPETLTVFGRRLLRIYMSPTVIGIYRLAVTEANRFPDLAKAFYEQGPGRTTVRLAQILQEAQKRDEIRMGDCRQLADRFIGMIRDNLHLQVVLGLRPPPSEKEIRNAVESAVDLFLNGIRVNREQ